MCGLAGVALFGGRELTGTDDALLNAMTHAVAHRGPDEQVLVREGGVGLGFTRLSLVAPENGGQPLYSPDGSVVLIANGEVYNHRDLAARLPAGTCRAPAGNPDRPGRARGPCKAGAAAV